MLQPEELFEAGKASLYQAGDGDGCVDADNDADKEQQGVDGRADVTYAAVNHSDGHLEEDTEQKYLECVAAETVKCRGSNLHQIAAQARG